jgi:hemolysin activation/secretion protein
MGASSRIGVALLLATLGHSVQAAQPPSSGQLLQEVPVATPPSTPAAPAIAIVRPEEGIAASGETFLVREITVSGNTVLSYAELHAIVAPAEGTMLTLADLQRLAQKITARYEQHGYPFSQAYIPAQAIREGRVQIAVLEAHYDNVVLRNSSAVRDSVVRVALGALKPDMPVEQSSLDRALLLESDLPGTAVQGTLRPGKTPGASELQVDVTPAPATSGSVSADDYGSAATGRERLNGSFNWNNPLHAGDVLSLAALSAGDGMNYGRIGYDVPVYGAATRLEAHVSTLGYRVVNGSEASLHAHGAASIAGAGLEQSLWRTTDFNLSAQFAYEDTLLRDHVDVTDIRTDRHIEDLRASTTATLIDRTGISTASAAVTSGRVLFDNAGAQLVDSSGARTGGEYVKYVLGFSRLQRLTATTTLSAALSYQGADKNLDSSEQFFIGGPNSVRAYDNGVVSGTLGESLILELRQDLLQNQSGRWQGIVNVDSAHVQLEKNDYGAFTNAANLSGTGVGLNWFGLKSCSVMSVVSTPVGGTPAAAGKRDSVRVWVRIQKDL